MTQREQTSTDPAPADSRFPGVSDEDVLLPQLVAHLREHRTKLRQEWTSDHVTQDQVVRKMRLV